MVGIAVLILLVLGGLIAAQLAFSRRFVSLYRNRRGPDDVPFADPPRVLLVLALRGADPFLSETVKALANLDYEAGYDLKVVVDSREDPAYSLVQNVIAESDFPRMELVELKDPPVTCGLRVAALVQAFRDLDPSYGAVAWIDADVIPHRNWLSDLVKPLRDPDVGATTGIRWYLPNPGDWGTVVRAMWNIGGVIQMVYFQIAFGGSMCMRADIVRDPGFLSTWEKLLWEDTFTAEAMRRARRKLEFVPAATMGNTETISLRRCFRFMSRQMLNVRLYHGKWKALFLFGFLSSVTPYVGVVFAGWAALQQETRLAALVVVASLLQVTAMVLLYSWAGAEANRVAREHRNPNWRFPAKVVLAYPLTAGIYLFSLCSIFRRRRVNWRGIEYRVDGPFQVHREEWVPYRSADAGLHSL